MKITIFDSLTDPQGRALKTTWYDFCRARQNETPYPDKKSQPLVKIGIFDNDSRGQGSSLLTVCGVEGDYDEGRMSATAAANLLRSAGIESVVCSTFTSNLDHPKWRVFAPTSRELPADLRQYLVHALDSVLGNVLARESYVPKQTFFVGRNPAENYVFLHVKGQPVDVVLRDQANAAYTKDKREKAEREQLAATICLRAETQRNRKAAGRLIDGQISPIDAFNDGHSVRAILQTHGYRAKGQKFIAPTSASGMPGVVILQGQDGRERAFSHHTNDPLADGLAHDAFDLFRILDHNGDEWQAIQAAAQLLTTRTGATIMHHNRNAYRKQRAIARAVELQQRRAAQ